MALVEYLVLLSRVVPKDGSWHLGESTLLSAYRHGKFSPWDDKVEIIVANISEFTSRLDEGLRKAGLNKKYHLTLALDLHEAVLSQSKPCALQRISEDSSFALVIRSWQHYAARSHPLHKIPIWRFGGAAPGCTCTISAISLYCPSEETTRELLSMQYGEKFESMDTREFQVSPNPSASDHVLTCLFRDTRPTSSRAGVPRRLSPQLVAKFSNLAPTTTDLISVLKAERNSA